MSKHTPGPWEGCDRDTCHLIYAKGYENPICRVESYSLRFGPGQSERAANARLIAAAPDLLASLKAIVPVVVNRILEPSSDQSLKDMILGACDAIAKAEGQS